MKSGVELRHVGESPGVEVVEHALIFGELVGVFFEESVGGGGDGVFDPEGSGNPFGKLGLAHSQLALESENKGSGAREGKVALDKG